jgi:rod shape-determining protein MreC
MRGLLFLLVKYGGVVLFVLFECIAFYLVVNHNTHQRSIYVNSTNVFFGYLNEKATNIENFSRLQEVNDSLHLENAKLIEKIINIPGIQLTPVDIDIVQDQDTTQYKLLPSRICGKNVYLRNNYFTLCKGSADGIRKDMGVISSNGVVGKVSKVSEHYSLVITLLNVQSGISAMVLNNAYSGTLIWDVSDTKMMTLTGIPKHAKLSIGDTISTSGYSTVFPKGIMIGRIQNFELPDGDNNYRINVSLNTDIQNEEIVYIIDNQREEEQLILEQEIINQ